MKVFVLTGMQNMMHEPLVIARSTLGEAAVFLGVAAGESFVGTWAVIEVADAVRQKLRLPVFEKRFLLVEAELID